LKNVRKTITEKPKMKTHHVPLRQSVDVIEPDRESEQGESDESE
jgi:hypothetical protein